MKCIAETHLFGSRTGYRCLAHSGGISAKELQQLGTFGFGQTGDQGYQASLAYEPAGYCRRLASGRFAVTRCFAGPNDDAGRATLELRTIVVDSDVYEKLCSAGFDPLMHDGAFWDRDAFQEGAEVPVDKFTTARRRRVESDDLIVLDGWLLSLDRDATVAVLPDDPRFRTAILRLPQVLQPEDRTEFLWGIRLLSTGTGARVATLANGANRSGRWQAIQVLPERGLGSAALKYLSESVHAGTLERLPTKRVLLAGAREESRLESAPLSKKAFSKRGQRRWMKPVLLGSSLAASVALVALAVVIWSSGRSSDESLAAHDSSSGSVAATSESSDAPREELLDYATPRDVAATADSPSKEEPEPNRSPKLPRQRSQESGDGDPGHGEGPEQIDEETSDAEESEPASRGSQEQPDDRRQPIIDVPESDDDSGERDDSDTGSDESPEHLDEGPKDADESKPSSPEAPERPVDRRQPIIDLPEPEPDSDKASEREPDDDLSGREDEDDEERDPFEAALERIRGGVYPDKGVKSLELLVSYAKATHAVFEELTRLADEIDHYERLNEFIPDHKRQQQAAIVPVFSSACDELYIETYIKLGRLQRVTIDALERWLREDDPTTPVNEIRRQLQEALATASSIRVAGGRLVRFDRSKFWSFDAREIRRRLQELKIDTRGSSQVTFPENRAKRIEETVLPRIDRDIQNKVESASEDEDNGASSDE